MPAVDQDPNETLPSFARTSPNMGFDAALLQAVPAPPPAGGDTLALTLLDRIEHDPRRRVWRAVDPQGATYVVEERSVGRVGIDPFLVDVLPQLVDRPVGSSRHGDHELRVFRRSDGETLAQRLGRDRPPADLESMLGWLRGVARLLYDVHTAGFAVLRLAPAHVAFRGDGTVGFEGFEGFYPLSLPISARPGVLGYMPPEVADAEGPVIVDARQDIYAFAMLVYACIARRAPPACAESGFTPVLAPRDFEPAFPVGLAPFFARCAASNPAVRPSSALDALALLERCVRRILDGARGERSTVYLTASCETHPGIQKRLVQSTNQDSVFCAVEPDRNAVLMGVSDGVSTAAYGSGDIASALSLRRFRRAWSEFVEQPGLWDHGAAAERLALAMQETNADIVQYVNERFAPFGGEPQQVMGSTCVAMFAKDHRAIIASLGDSRAYLVREGMIEQITRDHNLMTLGIIDGMPAHMAVTMPQASALARCLGMFEIDPDGQLVASLVKPDIYFVDLLPGDRILLCTDGLTDYAGDSEAAAETAIYEVLMREPTPELACLDLIVLGNRGGGGDNIGVAVCVVGETPISAANVFDDHEDDAT
jgi:protein phosphatase